MGPPDGGLAVDDSRSGRKVSRGGRAVVVIIPKIRRRAGVAGMHPRRVPVPAVQRRIDTAAPGARWPVGMSGIEGGGAGGVTGP